MHILGAVLIISASLSLGLMRTEGERKSLNTLCSVSAALELLRAELATRLLSIPELCEFLKERSEGPAAQFFKSLEASLINLGEEDFSSLWRKSAESSLGLLRKEDLSAVISLGNVLGKFELSQQLQSLNRVIGLLSTSLADKKRNFPAQQKLSLGLSAAGGFLILLTLI